MVFKIVYTCSRGDFSIFLTYTDLAAEVADALRVCTDAMSTYGAKIASIPVDNAAKGTGGEVCKHLKKASCGNVQTSRDPAHCIDLCSKDLAHTPVVQRVVADGKMVRDLLVEVDRIDSIKRESVIDLDCHLEECFAIMGLVDTRMNLVDLFIESVRKQHDLLSCSCGWKHEVSAVS